MLQKISPFLWFAQNNSEEAINFYLSAFKDSRLIEITRYPENSTEEHMKGMGGKVLTAVFELDGQQFMALDGGPVFTMNPSVSFFVNFDPSQRPHAKEDLDELWGKLSDGGKVLMPLQEYPFSKHYGWVQDKFGVSWQLILTNPEGEERPHIVPSFLFVNEAYGKAEEAMNFYLSVFKDSRKGTLALYPEDMGPNKKGTVMFEDFMLEGHWFAAMDGGGDAHAFHFNEAISFLVECDTQEELDGYWDKLSAHPENEQCGWLKDAFGVSWQIVPKAMSKYMADPDKEKSGRVIAAMMQMKKIDIAKLNEAYAG